MDHLDALERLARLRDSGALSEAEFNSQKQRLLEQDHGPRPMAQSFHSPVDDAEHEVDQFRGSTRGWLFGSFAGWMTLLLCLLPFIVFFTSNDSAVTSLSAIGTAAGVVIVLVKWIANISARYELTSHRMILRTGIIFKRVDEIELFRVKDVRVDFSLINQITGIGTLCLRSSDASSHAGDFILRDIPRACDRRETLRGLVDQARQRRRVRELDVDGSYA